MVDNAIFKDYLALIEQACKAGNATEHTHRPALKGLLEAFQPGITATNEPKRIKCGAPDYIITRKDIPLGFVEAKDIGVSLDDTEDSEHSNAIATASPISSLPTTWNSAGMSAASCA